MIYNLTIWHHPEADGSSFWVWFLSGTVISDFVSRDLNLHPNWNQPSSDPQLIQVQNNTSVNISIKSYCNAPEWIKEFY